MLGERLIILRKRVPGLNGTALARFVVCASRAARLQGAVNVLVTTSRELQRLNYRFLGKNRPTDVLSFPPMPGLETAFAGDVAISAEIAAQNSQRMGHSAAEEVKILTLHGLLHLAGHDHEHDDGEMARKEARLREKLGLPVGLIERAQRPRRSQKPLTAKRVARKGASVGPGAIRKSR
jgi:probable rRNA maturation factor